MDDGRAGKHNAAPRFNGVLDAVRVHDEVVGDDERTNSKILFSTVAPLLAWSSTSDER